MEGEIRERKRGERESKRKKIERKRILGKSPKRRNKAQYYTKLSRIIMLRNHQLVYYVAQK